MNNHCLQVLVGYNESFLVPDDDKNNHCAQVQVLVGCDDDACETFYDAFLVLVMDDYRNKHGLQLQVLVYYDDDGCENI